MTFRSLFQLSCASALFGALVSCENAQWGLPEDYSIADADLNDTWNDENYSEGITTQSSRLSRSGTSRRRDVEEVVEPTSSSSSSSGFNVNRQFFLNLPEGAQKVQVWIPRPQDDSNQSISDFQVVSGYPNRAVNDQLGNEYVYIEIENPTELEALPITASFNLQRKASSNKVSSRKAKALSDNLKAQMAPYLGSSSYILVNDKVRSLSAQIVGTEKNPLKAARKIYNWLLENCQVQGKSGAPKGAPVGSSEYCLTYKGGTSADLNALWAALARAADIPTRLVYGSIFNPNMAGAEIGGHCWNEFYVSGLGWLPMDIAMGDLYHGKGASSGSLTARAYSGPNRRVSGSYFGNIDGRRVAWMRGRDATMMDPQQAGGPIDNMVTAYIEVDGVKFDSWTEKLVFTEG